jgi:hypothetical protein
VNFSLKVKSLSEVPKGIGMRLLFLFSLTLLSLAAQAQVQRQPGAAVNNLRAIAQDTIPLDSVKAKQDSLARKRRKKDIDSTIEYSARDSINSSLDRKVVHLYGDAHIKYGEIQLMAEDVTIDYEKSTIAAEGRVDSLGRHVGFPIFINGSEKYETQSIVYNFKTRKALISEVVTKQGENILHGKAVFKNAKGELLSIRNGFTTCDLAHPHYQIIASKAKAIPNDKMVAGPFHMEVNDVPLPLGFIFGIFPNPRKSASGIIVPTYGEEQNRGFFLRNGGYFFDVNDYFKLQLTGDIYSKGSSAIYVNSNYRKRYKHNGSFNFSFTNNYTNDNIENKNTVKDFRVTWSHTPQTRGTGRFSASVNAATATYNNSNFLGVNTNPAVPRLDNTSRKLSSNISYSKTLFNNVVALGINFRINQDLTTKQVDLPLPDLSMNVNNLYPLKKMGDGMLLQNFSLRYSMTATNQITNNLGRNFRDLQGNPIAHDSIAPFNLANLPTFVQNARKGVKHNIPLASSFKILRFFTVSPALVYDELWYFEKLQWGLSNDLKSAVVVDTIHQFNRVVNYSANVSMTTRIYGTYHFKKANGIQAIRHVINPSVGMSFSPNFGDPSYGYYQKFDTLSGLRGTSVPLYKSVHEGFAYGSSRIGESASLSFGVNNTVEMKVKSKKDTVAKKVSLFNTLSVASGYNFAADSFKLAPFGMAANTNVLNDKLNVNLSGSLDPYRYIKITDEKGTVVREVRTSEYAWGKPYQPGSTYGGWTVLDGIGHGVGRITNANLALSTNLSPKGQKKDNDTRAKIGKSNASEADKKFLLANPDSYIDFNIPWNLRVSYNADYSHPVNSSPLITQAMRLNGDFSITQKWKITFNTGYDFQQNEITQTYLTIARDLHCWQVNLGWTPFGKYQSYNFYIGIKSQLLKDLKLNRTRSFYDSQ